MPTILQISDTHLSPRNGLFLENIEVLRLLALTLRPDLTVFSGDLSLDGADDEADLAFAAERLGRFPGPLLFLPGNHDIGSDPVSMPHQPVDENRLARFRRHFGAGRGMVDLPGWRVIGLNTEVMGTGVAEEAAQATFIAEAAATLGEQHIALFLHKPILVAAQDHPLADPWSVPPVAWPSLAPLLHHPRLRLVASGHLHMFRQSATRDVRNVWAPPTCFVFDAEEQDGIAGDRRCGAVLLRLEVDVVQAELLHQGMVTTHIDAVRHLTYPRPAIP